MPDADPLAMFRKRLVIVSAIAWWSAAMTVESYNDGTDAARRWTYYLATIEANGEVEIFRPIVTDKLDAERATVEKHNADLVEFGTALAADIVEVKKKREKATRATASATRKPPTNTGMFTAA